MSRTSKRTLIALASVALVMVFGVFGLSWPRSKDDGPGSGRTLSAPTPRAEDRFALEEGGRLYAQYCQACHGDSGRGDGRFYASALEPTPADFTASAFRNERTDTQLYAAIAGGSRSVGRSDLCPAWGQTFSTTEVEYLVAYIRQLQRTRETAPANPYR